jgi:hypothetical protein
VTLVVRARLRRRHDRGAVRRDDGERLCPLARFSLRFDGRDGRFVRLGRGGGGLWRERFQLRREPLLDGAGLIVQLFERRVDVLDVLLFLDRLVAHHVEHDLGHPRRLAALRALEDDVLHLAAAEVLHLLLTEHP